MLHLDDAVPSREQRQLAERMADAVCGALFGRRPDSPADFEPEQEHEPEGGDDVRRR